MSNQSELKDYLWFKHYDEGVPKHIAYPEKDLFTLLQQKVAEQPQVTALMFFGKETGYGQLLEKINRCMNAMHNLGIKKGDKVALLLPTNNFCRCAYHVHRDAQSSPVFQV